mgnify:FL=1|jgi:hypothetical protein
MEQLLIDNMKDFSNYLIQNCEDDEKIELIHKHMNSNLSSFEIMLFINFLNMNDIDSQINHFIQMFKIKDNDEIKMNIKKYIDYFIEIKEILNN